MGNLFFDMINYRNLTDGRVRQLETILQNSPDGNLRIIQRNNNCFFDVRKTEKGSRKGSYISKDNEALLECYSKKRFAAEMLPKLRKNLKAANAFISLHSGIEETEIAARLHPEIISRCKSIYLPPEEFAKDWLNSKGPECILVGNPPSIKTISGEQVRSKSEAIIYNSLYSHGLVFQYERGLYLPTNNYASFPDFTILLLSTLEEMFWEHFGMMDDPDYAESAIKKICNYIQNGIIPGKNLICTFETRNQPLSSADVETLIREFLL